LFASSVLGETSFPGFSYDPFNMTSVYFPSGLITLYDPLHPGGGVDVESANETVGNSASATIATIGKSHFFIAILSL
jgi:hypothetical protein